jgi:hypothetical protein
MDQHPIPQDVTGFQFKLIGTMTVKQFGYVASGVVLAVVLYYMPLHGFFGILAKVVLIPIFGGSGALIAFVPIEGRPIDLMATNFFKAIFSPNQYVYRKVGRKFSFSDIHTTAVDPAAAAAAKQATPSTPKQKSMNAKGAQLQAYLRSTHNEVQSSLDMREQTLLNSLALPKQSTTITTTAPVAPAEHIVHPAPAAKPAVAAHPPVASVPKPVVHTATPAPMPPIAPQEGPMSSQEVTLSQQESQLQQQLQSAKQEETTTHAPTAHVKVVSLEKQLEEVHAQKQQLEKELQTLKTQLANQAPLPASSLVDAASPVVMQQPPAHPAPVPATAAVAPTVVIPKPEAPAIPAAQYAKTVSQTAAGHGDLPKVSDTPNVVVGIVKDARGNILPNILVEVKDQSGNPVRAFKTNALGQFASATPLSAGTYTLELDDPKKQHSFDLIQVVTNNQILMPIEVISHDAREALRQQLFN